jgi:hypothetical protein
VDLTLIVVVLAVQANSFRGIALDEKQ